MIPKKIHYCWFGGNEKPQEILQCYESWKKYCPDYEIIEWNEENFDVNLCQYAAEAYKEKKWAFVSDYARIRILLEQGGIYMDTDVELIKPIDDLLNQEAFLGFEEGLGVNSGLIMGSIAGHRFLAEQESQYKNYNFIKDGKLNLTSCVEYTTKLLVEHGLKIENSIQHVMGVTIYPIDYFSPLNMNTGALNITENTYSIHRYAGSWASDSVRYGYHLKWKYIKKYGIKLGGFLYKIPYMYYIIKHDGIKALICKIFQKMK